MFMNDLFIKGSGAPVCMIAAIPDSHNARETEER